MLNYESGLGLYRELKIRYDGNLAQVYAYINNAIIGMMGYGRTSTGQEIGEVLYSAAEFAQSEMVEQYMIEHGYYRPDPHTNIWEKKE